jgi:CxxC motif-containing protein (DUF1111 family)
VRITRGHVSRILRAGVIVCALVAIGGASDCARKPKPGEPLPGLKRSERARFDRGKGVFAREFTPETGLGPLFNSTSCAECHEDPATGGSGDEVEIHATAFHPPGASQPHAPSGAGQDACDPLVDEGGPVIQQHVTPALHDATGIDAEPVPARATGTGRRTTPSILGFGLLDSVPDEEILARADPDDRDHDGISGRPNRFTDGRLGRFGRKGFVPSLREFTAGAFVIEQGITNPAQPAEETIGGRPIPSGVDPVPEPELSQEDLDLAVDFVRFLAPPEHGAGGLAVVHGGGLFASIGCASCHVPVLRTGTSDARSLRRREVAAYTDLLLHDMGPDLADICLGLATPSEFRTEPLMGLRLRKHFLHDGRAATIEEAIRLHAGEATASREKFQALRAEERREVLGFLGSL